MLDAAFDVRILFDLPRAAHVWFDQTAILILLLMIDVNHSRIFELAQKSLPSTFFFRPFFVFGVFK